MWVFPEICNEAVAVRAECLEVGRVIIGTVIVHMVYIELTWQKCCKSAVLAAILEVLTVLFPHP